MSIEAALAGLTAALEKNTEHLARVIAGQEAAMAKLEGSPAATRTTRKKAEPAADAALATGNSEAAPTAAPATASAAEASPPAAKPTPAADERVYTQDDLKAAAMDWRGSIADEDGRKDANNFLMAMVSHFGSPKLSGPECTLTSEQIGQAIFYVARKKAGLSVDFNADYDFDGDPIQGGAAAPAAEEDPFG